MEVLWAAPEGQALTVREVHETLNKQRTLAYTTVMTVLDRLARKGLTAQEREGRAYRYRAEATRAELTAELMRETLDDFSSHDRSQALVAFVDEASADDLAALRRALASLEDDDR
jgi:predicted transcriptional regulator